MIRPWKHERLTIHGTHEVNESPGPKLPDKITTNWSPGTFVRFRFRSKVESLHFVKQSPYAQHRTSLPSDRSTSICFILNSTGKGNPPVMDTRLSDFPQQMFVIATKKQLRERAAQDVYGHINSTSQRRVIRQSLKWNRQGNRSKTESHPVKIYGSRTKVKFHKENS